MQLAVRVRLSHTSTYLEMCFFGHLHKISLLQVSKLQDHDPCISKRSLYSVSRANLKLLNSFFFTVTVIDECYQQFIFSFLLQLNKLKRYFYFQQDIAHTHSIQSTVALLNKFLKII